MPENRQEEIDDLARSLRLVMRVLGKCWDGIFDLEKRLSTGQYCECDLKKARETVKEGMLPEIKISWTVEKI